MMLKVPPYQNLFWEEKLFMHKTTVKTLWAVFSEDDVDLVRERLLEEIRLYIKAIDEYGERYANGVQWCIRCGRTGLPEGFTKDWELFCPRCGETDRFERIHQLPTSYENIIDKSKQYIETLLLAIKHRG
jgi:hypothetical protein